MRGRGYSSTSNCGLTVTLKSPHTPTLPFFFTGVTIRAAHSLVATVLITHSASSSLSASSTAGLRANANGRAFQNRGFAPSLVWNRALIFLSVPSPSENKLAKGWVPHPSSHKLGAPSTPHCIQLQLRKPKWFHYLPSVGRQLQCSVPLEHMTQGLLVQPSLITDTSQPVSSTSLPSRRRVKFSSTVLRVCTLHNISPSCVCLIKPQ